MYGNTSPNLNDTTAGLASRHEETMAQLKRTVSQAEDLLRALGDESGEAMDAMRTRVSATLNDARARLSGRATQARDLASTTFSQADAYVRSNPWQAIAIGAGVGMILAMMMSGSRTRDDDYT